MNTFIKEPSIPRPVEYILNFAEERIGHKMMPARLLLWTPKAFVSSMILEGLIAHKKGRVNKRMLKLIRMQVSLLIACPFCIDMNSDRFREYGITNDEIKGMQELLPLENVSTFSKRERLVLAYCRGLVRTPIRHDTEVVEAMKKAFNEKEFATIVTTIAQVDYWTRVIQGFGIQPAGFLEACDFILMTNKEKKNM